MLSEISDHLPIIMFMNLYNKLKTSRYKEKVLNQRTLSHLRESIQVKIWVCVYNCNDPDTAYNSLISVITDSVRSTITEKAVKMGISNKNAWITKEILKMISHKNKQYKCYIKNPTDEN